MFDRLSFGQLEALRNVAVPQVASATTPPCLSRRGTKSTVGVSTVTAPQKSSSSQNETGFPGLWVDRVRDCMRSTSAGAHLRRFCHVVKPRGCSALQPPAVLLGPPLPNIDRALLAQLVQLHAGAFPTPAWYMTLHWKRVSHATEKHIPGFGRGPFEERRAG